jgi:hypothetical protein
MCGHTRAKAPNFIAQCLSGFENPLPRTKVRGYTRTSVFPQPVKPAIASLCAFAGLRTRDPGLKSGVTPRVAKAGLEAPVIGAGFVLILSWSSGLA